MGFFFEGYTVATVLGFLALTAALVVLNELTRRSKIFSILVYCVLPVVLVVKSFRNFYDTFYPQHARFVPCINWAEYALHNAGNF